MKVEIEISSGEGKDLPTQDQPQDKPMTKDEVLAKLRELFKMGGPGSQLSPEALKEEIDSLMEQLTGEQD